MALLSFILGILGNITALLGLVSPMPTFWKIMKKGSAGSFSSQPYLFSLMSALFWTYYGILKKGGIFVVTISATSSAFQVFYLAVYLWFGSQRQRRKTLGILFVILISYAAMIVSTMLFEHGGQPLVTVGILCTVTSVFSTAAPLTIIHKVVKTGSVEYMPFYLSLGLFLNGSCWLAYALSLKDMFITIPNAIGVTLSSIQLALYAFYRTYGGKRKALVQAVADEKTMSKIAIEQDGAGDKTFAKMATEQHASMAPAPTTTTMTITTTTSAPTSHVCSCGAIINLNDTTTNEASTIVDVASDREFQAHNGQNTNKTNLHHIDIGSGPPKMMNFPPTLIGHSLVSPSPFELEEITVSAK